MKLISSLLLLSLAACASVPQAAPQGDPQAVPAPVPEPVSTASRDNRITLYLGQRNLDEDDYMPVDEQGVFGVEYVRESPGSIIGWEIGLMGSYDEDRIGGFDVEGSTGELYTGVHKTFLTGVVRPYVGAGISFINSEVEVVGLGKDDDDSVAGYAHLGVMFHVTELFFLGLDVRALFGSDMTIAGVSTDADYGQLALNLGWAF